MTWLLQFPTTIINTTHQQLFNQLHEPNAKSSQQNHINNLQLPILRKDRDQYRCVSLLQRQALRQRSAAFLGLQYGPKLQKSVSLVGTSFEETTFYTPDASKLFSSWWVVDVFLLTPSKFFIYYTFLVSTTRSHTYQTTTSICPYLLSSCLAMLVRLELILASLNCSCRLWMALQVLYSRMCSLRLNYLQFSGSLTVSAQKVQINLESVQVTTRQQYWLQQQSMMAQQSLGWAVWVVVFSATSNLFIVIIFLWFSASDTNNYIFGFSHHHQKTPIPTPLTPSQPTIHPII